MNSPCVFIQWKGTDVCLDFYCICGKQAHVDGEFVYSLRCWNCGAVYRMPSHLALQQVDPASEVGDITETQQSENFP